MFNMVFYITCLTKAMYNYLDLFLLNKQKNKQKTTPKTNKLDLTLTNGLQPICFVVCSNTLFQDLVSVINNCKGTFFNLLPFVALSKINKYTFFLLFTCICAFLCACVFLGYQYPCIIYVFLSIEYELVVCVRFCYAVR